MLRSANFYNFSAKTPKIFNFLLIFLHFTLLRKQNTRPENTTSERETPQKEKKIFLPLHQTNDFVKNCKHEFLHATHGFQPDLIIFFEFSTLDKKSTCPHNKSIESDTEKNERKKL